MRQLRRGIGLVEMMISLNWDMLYLKLVKDTRGFFGGDLSNTQPEGRMRKKNQQKKLKG